MVDRERRLTVTLAASTDRQESAASPEHLAGDRSTWSDIASPDVSRIGDRTLVNDAPHLRSSSTYDSHASSGPTPHGPSGSTGLTSSMMRTVVSSGNDALNLLFEAAAHTDTQNSHLEPRRDSGGRHDYSHSPGNIQTPGATAIAIGTSPAAPPAVEISNPSRDVLNVWGSCRFVKMGWFTAKEAITYVDLWERLYSSRKMDDADSVSDSSRTYPLYRQSSATTIPTIRTMTCS
jgi:hypothetical protein